MIADGTEPGTSSDDERSARDAVGDARQRTLRRTEALERSVAEIVEAAPLTSTDDEHDPEGATIAYERAQASALLRRARTDLDLLDDAARRLDEGGGTACALRPADRHRPGAGPGDHPNVRRVRILTRPGRPPAAVQVPSASARRWSPSLRLARCKALSTDFSGRRSSAAISA